MQVSGPQLAYHSASVSHRLRFGTGWSCMADMLNETSCCVVEGFEMGADPGSRAGHSKLEPCSHNAATPQPVHNRKPCVTHKYPQEVFNMGKSLNETPALATFMIILERLGLT